MNSFTTFNISNSCSQNAPYITGHEENRGGRKNTNSGRNKKNNNKSIYIYVENRKEEKTQKRVKGSKSNRKGGWERGRKERD
jgi:hypothetical protein